MSSLLCSLTVGLLCLASNLALAEGQWVRAADPPEVRAGDRYTAVLRIEDHLFLGTGGALWVFDGGSWHTEILGDGPVFDAIVGRSTNEVYAVGHYYAIWRWDGDAWHREHLDLGQPKGILDHVFFHQGEVYATGPTWVEGRPPPVFKRIEDGWKRLRTVPEFLSLPPNPCPEDQAWIDRTDGAGDPVAHCEDGPAIYLGGRWRRLGLPEKRFAQRGYSIWSDGNAVVYLISPLSSRAYRYNAQLGLWQAEPAPTRLKAIGWPVSGRMIAVTDHTVLERRP